VTGVSEGPSAGGGERMTIDELARRAGTVTSTVRMYQTRGLLPPPRKEGRVGYYGEGHLARLRLISGLQADGFSLASIGRLVEAWEQGRSLDDVLGLEAQITATWGADEPVELTADELAERLPEGAILPGTLARAIDLGLVAARGDRMAVQPVFLEIGLELARLGIPMDEILDEHARLQEATAVVAERFTRLFERHLWEPFLERGLPAGEVRRLTDVLQRLSALAEGVVVVALRVSLQRAAATFLAAQAERLDEAGLLDSVRPLAAAAGLDLHPGPDPVPQGP
jgi:DNA-binding transcriptional MerR regulator